MIVEAVDGMRRVTDIAIEAEKDKIRDRALLIASLVLTLVPITGEVGASFAGALNLAKMFAAVGLAANTALTIHEAVTNPEGAPAAFFQLVMMGGGIGGGVKKAAGTESVVQKAAKDRRMWLGNGKSLGEGFKKRETMLTNIGAVCRRKS
jgi:hypothetical protein